MERDALIRAADFGLDYRLGTRWVRAVQHIDLSINPQAIHGLVGESGSGKSTLALSLMGYWARNARVAEGRVWFEGQDLTTLGAEARRALWGRKAAFVPQNPQDALNPSMSIGAQLMETTRHHLGHTPAQARRAALEALQAVRLPDPELLLRRYPHQLSGGQLQRVLIAQALSTRPCLLVLDEPTTALDVTTQAAILDLVRDLIHRERAAALYVTHDLGTARRLCDQISVLYGGEIMESAVASELFSRPLHPYTIGLLESLPHPESANEARLSTIGGVAPSLSERPAGCVFANRCPLALAHCHAEKPPPEAAAPGHEVRCWRWSEIAQGQVSATKRPPSPSQAAPPRAERVLRVVSLSKRYAEGGWWRRGQGVQALQPTTLHINGRATLGVVGESGSGKTTLARAIVALAEADGGQLELLGQPLPLRLRQRSAAMLREVQMVFQNPNDSLNPYQTVGQAIGRALRKLSSKRFDRRQVDEQVRALLDDVGLSEAYALRTPDQLSGGEKQRVAIARAFAAHPALVIADEPTSALDVSVQAVILNLLKDLRARHGTSYLLISHDLDVVAYLADWVVVMYLGEIVEQGTTEQVYGLPRHPYTEMLLAAHEDEATVRRDSSADDVPSARRRPSGCPLHTRCPRIIGEICRSTPPPMQTSADGHAIRCHHNPEALRAMQSASSQATAEGA
ncbi:MAG: ABC transporter ATP-binding protein [Anaerolineae bacterium]|nr:ABC transporter ATP-binding protein [Anaerolineae bacterium]